MQDIAVTSDSDLSRLHILLDILKNMESVVIAYSGGVDSTFLLKAATIAGIKTMAVTALSPTMPAHDLKDAKAITQELGVLHLLIETSELENAAFSKNPIDRCFYCKDELFAHLRDIAIKQGYKFVIDGTNLDDTHDWRPGRKAAQKHGIRSPLIEAGMRKSAIRHLSYSLRLSTWDKPASPCLSSRFPYGEPITLEALKQVEAAENFLKSFGFREFRVRHSKDTARIELKEEDIPKILLSSVRTSVVEKLHDLGYKIICIDLEGFKSGRLNE